MTYRDPEETSRRILAYIKHHHLNPKTELECQEIARQLIIEGILPDSAEEIIDMGREYCRRNGLSHPMFDNTDTLSSSRNDDTSTNIRSAGFLDPHIYDIEPLLYDPADVDDDEDDENY